MRYWDHDYGLGWLGPLAMAVTMLIFWGGLVTLVVVLVRRQVHPAHRVQHPSGPDAERILDERFARGEIDEEELTARRTVLRGDGAR